MACTCPDCDGPVGLGRRAAGFLFWSRWNCRCGARLRWEHAEALTGGVVLLAIATAIALGNGRPEVVAGIVVVLLIAMFVMNRAELVHPEGRCLRCGYENGAATCPECGWVDWQR